MDASVRITYRTGGLEQDILLHEVPPLPDGWDPERASIEVVTEFVECPAPRTQSLDVGAAADAGLAGLAGGSRVTYEILDFGAMQIMGGVAFAEPSAEAGAWGRPEAPVRKQWSLKEGPRPRLIERLDYPALRALSEKLPRQAQRASHPGPTRLAAASAPRATGAPMAIASRSRPVPAAVIDFDTVHSCPSQVFATDQTYRLDSQVTISSLTEFQSGAILKFRDAGSLIVSGTLTSPDPVRPRVYFTHVDDDTIGEPGLGDGVLDTGYPCALRLFNMAQASTV